MKTDFNISIADHLISNEDAFDLLYKALRNEFERQKQLEKDMPKGAFNVSALVVYDFLKQLEEQNPSLYLSAKFVYERDSKNLQ